MGSKNTECCFVDILQVGLMFCTIISSSMTAEKNIALHFGANLVWVLGEKLFQLSS